MSVEKKFIATKADMGGVSLTPYKLVKPDWFSYVTVTSRNSDKLTLAHNDSPSTYIVSSSYEVFRVGATGRIDPKYLFMYINRPEFDRYARFNSWGSARETYSWEDFCDAEIELPPIEVQRKYVAIYEAMLTNQRAYESGLDDLKLTCDALLDSCKEAEEWRPVGDFLSEVDRRNEFGACDVAYGINISKEFMLSKASSEDLLKYKLVEPGQLACNLLHVGRDASYPIAVNEGECALAVSPAYSVFNATDSVIAHYLMAWFSRDEVGRNGWFICDDSIRGSMALDRFLAINIPTPNRQLIEATVAARLAYNERFVINNRLKAQLKDICPILIRGSIEEAMR